MSARVVLVDDHELIATTLVAALRRRGLRADWCAGPGPHLDDLLETDPGLVLLDLDLGLDDQGREIEAVELIRPAYAAGWRVLVITGSRDESRFADALSEGAEGWISKAARFDDLVEACLAASRGHPVIPPETRRRLLTDRRARRVAEKDVLDRLNRLTTRELQILDALASGVRVPEIAGRAFVSVATVRSQVKSIRTKLGVGSQLEAAALYRRGR